MSHKSEKRAAAHAAAAQIASELNSKIDAAAEQSAAAEKSEDSKTDEPAAKTDEPAEEKKVSKVVNSKTKTAFLEPLIASGEFTQKELAEKMQAEFPQMTMVTINTFLTDSKNVKYNKFDRLVIVTADKKLAFAAEIQEAA